MLSAGRFASAPAFAVVSRDALGVIARANDERASQPPRRYETRHLGVPVRTFYGSEASDPLEGSEILTFPFRARLMCNPLLHLRSSE